jgi:ribosomal protein L22
VDQGTTLKRFMPKGFGRANPIDKKTSRIRLVLEHRVEAKAEPVKELSK